MSSATCDTPPSHDDIENTMLGGESSQTQRTLKDLIAVCRRLGDSEDRSALLQALLVHCADVPKWSSEVFIERLAGIMHDCTIKLESYLEEVERGDSAGGGTYNLVKEWYWQFAPLTNELSWEEKGAPIDILYSIDAESVALYVETQVVFASLAALLTSEYDSMYGSKEDYNFFHVSTGIKIPWQRFVARTVSEIKRLQSTTGNVRLAFRLSILMHCEVILRLELDQGVDWENRCWPEEKPFSQRERETFNECTDLIKQYLPEENTNSNTGNPIDYTWAFLYITHFTEVTLCRDLKCVRRDLKWIYSSIRPWVLRDIEWSVLRAVGKKLPKELCQEVLGWSLALYGIALTSEDHDDFSLDCQGTMCKELRDFMEEEEKDFKATKERMASAE